MVTKHYRAKIELKPSIYIEKNSHIGHRKIFDVEVLSIL